MHLYRANDAARAAMALAVEVRLRHPNTPARIVLDEVISAYPAGSLVFGVVLPTTAFGQLVAEAFDGGMAPSDWIALSSHPDRGLHVFLHDTWETEVWPKFLAAYGDRLASTTTAL